MSNAPVIVFRLGSLGDTIFALPCFHAIRRHFPRRRIILLTNVPVSGNAAPLMAVLGKDGQFADAVIEYPLSLRNPRELLILARKIRATGADTLIYLMPERSAWQAWRDWVYLRFAVGLRRILCFPISADLRRVRKNPVTGELEREAARLARVCAAFGQIDLDDRRNWSLALTDAEIAQADLILAPFEGSDFIAVNMGGKAAKNDWGRDNWNALRDVLSARYPLGMLIVGAPEDETRASEFLAGWKGPKVNACGRLSPRASGAAMARARLFVGHDSGPMHLAAAMGTPVIGLFGDNNPPRKWHPVGRHVHVIHRMEGVREITVTEVLAEIDAVLATKQMGLPE